MTEEDLDKLRKKIDVLDEELLKTLARRMEIVARIGRYKKGRGLELRDEERMEELQARQLAKAKSLDLSEGFIAELYDLIYKYALALEAKV